MKTWKNLVLVVIIAILGTTVLEAQTEPKTAEEFRLRGNTCFQSKDYDQAIADYTQAITLDPNMASAYSSRGIAYELKNDKDRALADYTKAIQLNPNEASYYRNRGDIYFAQKDYDRATADYEKALQINPNSGSNQKALENVKQAKLQIQKDKEEQAERERLPNLYRQAGNNFGNLPNTSRRWIHPADASHYDTYNFGNGNYILESKAGYTSSTETGTFRVNGDTVIFLSSKGVYSSGTIVGTTITKAGSIWTGGNMVFR